METKTHAFKAEIREMLDLVVNSLYSKKEIFLRELISNASDAIDRAKYLGLTEKELVADNPEWRIDVVADRDAKTLMVSDNGSGMNAEELERNLGTIASSGTKKFREMLRAKEEAGAPELIGQFGVGFYAAFMVADRVRVVSKKRGEGKAWRWESDCGGTYTVAEDAREGFGTSVMLHLRPDQEAFLDEWKVRDLVKAYSDYIAHPIFFKALPEKKDGEGKGGDAEETPKPLNSMVALWKKAKKDVKPEEYAEFYRHLTHDWRDPLETVPFSGEGQVEFKALLFFPEQAGMDVYLPNSKRGLSLYVRNVFIGNDFEALLPDYLRFTKGVVDSSDLPLNVSREMLQDDAILRKIRNAVTSKVLGTLEDMKKKDAAKYLAFWKSFGRILKEGLHADFPNAERLKKLMLYPSAKTEAGKLISLGEYVKGMAAGQTDIYYVCAEKDADARTAPQIEQALKHGADVLLFTDPVDEWLVDSLGTFEGKAFKDVAKGEVSFGSEEEKKREKEALDKASADLKPFLDKVKEVLKDAVGDVRLSTRLADSPCCLVAAANAPSPAMARMMRAMNQDVPEEKRILEVNASHPLVEKIRALEGDALKDAVELLHGQALVAEGSPVPDPARFSRLLTGLMLKG